MLNEYRQQELDQMDKANNLDFFVYLVQEQFGDSFYEIAHQKTKINNVIFHQFLLGPLFDDCEKCIYTTSRDHWLKALEEKNDNLFGVNYQTTTIFGDDELLVVVCWNNEELKRRVPTDEQRSETIDAALDCSDFGYIDSKIAKWRTARAYNNGNEYVYDESIKNELDLPILESCSVKASDANEIDLPILEGCSLEVVDGKEDIGEHFKKYMKKKKAEEPKKKKTCCGC